MMKRKLSIKFPDFSGLRCLMMPFIQGDPDSVPDEYRPYRDILSSVAINKGDIGYLTIDESHVAAGEPHRGARAKFGRALHTEAGRVPGDPTLVWGGRWGTSDLVKLDRDTKILLANNQDGSCAVWDTEREDTTIDGDIGHLSSEYPYTEATLMNAGDVHEIGILTPHESLPSPRNFARQFLRILSSGVHGREPYFTVNPKMVVA